MSWTWVLICVISLILEVLLFMALKFLSLCKDRNVSKRDVIIYRYSTRLIHSCMFYIPLIITAIGFIWFGLTTWEIIIKFFLSVVVSLANTLLFMWVKKTKDFKRLFVLSTYAFQPIFYQIFLLI